MNKYQTTSFIDDRVELEKVDWKYDHDKISLFISLRIK